jgi:hypothetical protein
MQITAELDNQHLEKLQELEKKLKINTSEFIAFAIDEFYSKSPLSTEGERVLAILKNTGYLGGMPDVADLSENYKDYLGWGDKV